MVALSTSSRTLTKPLWKARARLARILLRETLKATEDMMIFGTGAIQFNSDGEAQRIDPAASFWR